LIIAITLGLFLYLQKITHTDIEYNLFLQQKERQIQSTKSISEHISSDLNQVIDMLDGLANSLYLQQGNFSGDQTKKLLDVSIRAKQHHRV
jgi:hypothetical protein